MTVKILYFAQFRELIGQPHEELELDPALETVSDLITWLKSRGEEYAQALSQESLIRVAINQTHVQHDFSLEGATEIALFPPMTGG